MDEVFYVQIEDAKDFRKNSLEATRLVIQTLQSLERLRKIRAEKADAIKKMTDLMSEISKLCDDVRIVPPPLDVEMKAEKKQQKKIPPLKLSAEANALEDAISQIEQKLKRLN